MKPSNCLGGNICVSFRFLTALVVLTGKLSSTPLDLVKLIIFCWIYEEVTLLDDVHWSSHKLVNLIVRLVAP